MTTYQHFVAFANRQGWSVQKRAKMWQLYKTDPERYEHEGWPTLERDFDDLPLDSPIRYGRMKNPKKRGKLHGAAKRAFLARMAKGRKRKANPAKLERCVRKVKRTRKVRNAYAVCTASFKKRRVRRRNAKGYSMRSGHYLVAVRGKTRLYYDGQHFSHKGSARLYPSRSAAASVGRGLVRHYPVLRAYRLYVGHT